MSSNSEDFKTARPLSDEDVDKARMRLAKLSTSDLNNIIETFSQLTNGILKMCLTFTDDENEIAEIERLKRLINLVRRLQ